LKINGAILQQKPMMHKGTPISKTIMKSVFSIKKGKKGSRNLANTL
jgi:hypothetical protein